jgi:hypothetical protein
MYCVKKNLATLAPSLEDRRMFVALAYFLFRKESLSDVFLGTRFAEI